jgi:hypothetical protein
MDFYKALHPFCALLSSAAKKASTEAKKMPAPCPWIFRTMNQNEHLL